MDIEIIGRGVLYGIIALIVIMYIYGLIVGDKKQIAGKSKDVVFVSTEDMFRHAAYAGLSGRTFEERVKDKAAMDMLNKYATPKDITYEDDGYENEYDDEEEDNGFSDNKEKGNFFEALIENDYTRRNYNVLKDNVLDSLYKVDIVAINEEQRNIEIVQCKYWSKDTGYIIDGDEIYDVLNLNIESLKYLKKKIVGIEKYSVHIKFLVTDYGFIDESSFISVFDSFREGYPSLKFSYHQVNWNDDYTLRYS